MQRERNGSKWLVTQRAEGDGLTRQRDRKALVYRSCRGVIGVTALRCPKRAGADCEERGRNPIHRTRYCTNRRCQGRDGHDQTRRGARADRDWRRAEHLIAQRSEGDGLASRGDGDHEALRRTGIDAVSRVKHTQKRPQCAWHAADDAGADIKGEPRGQAPASHGKRGRGCAAGRNGKRISASVHPVGRGAASEERCCIWQINGDRERLVCSRRNAVRCCDHSAETASRGRRA